MDGKMLVLPKVKVTEEDIYVDDELIISTMSNEYATLLFPLQTAQDVKMMDPEQSLVSWAAFYSHVMNHTKAIVYKGRPVGTLSYQESCFGFWVAHPYRGKQIAYRASLCFLKVLNDDRKAGSFDNNPASLHILRKLGFKEYTRYRDYYGNIQIWHERLAQA